jgi:16S rRNA (uracil1498-N3)-methyltransferase
MITLLVGPEEFAAGELTIAGERYRHLFRARRVEAGASLRLVDGLGHARWAQVAAVDRRQARLVAGDPAAANEPARALRLLVPLPRPERAAWLVEKTTEVGVAGIHFLHSERAPREAGGGTLARLRRVAAAAVEQCHRSREPEITGVHAWEELPVLLAGAASRWMLDPEAPPVPPTEAVPPAIAALLIGPEGGFTPAEAGRARDLGFVALGLGPTILRIETAALVGAARLLLE